MEPNTHVVTFHEPPRNRVRAWFDAFARRFPFAALAVVTVFSNLGGSFFNFFYNTQLIVGRVLDPRQTDVFWNLAAPVYNVVMYPICLGLLLYLVWPMMCCLARLRRDKGIHPAYLEFSRRRLVNFPFIQLMLNPLPWLPGAVFFPWVICTYGGTYEAGAIWGQFFVSFFISTVFTTVQTFFIIQS